LRRRSRFAAQARANGRVGFEHPSCDSFTTQEVTTLPFAGATRFLDPLFRTEEMRAIFSDVHFLECMLEFELALSRALARTGVAPAAEIRFSDRNALAASFDVRMLAEQARLAGNIAIPLVNALSTLVAEADPEAAKFVHWGATSQDLLDTALVLQLGEALLIFDDTLAKFAEALAALTERHKSTVLAGRTWLQQGPPTTFGLKAAGWLSAIERHRVRLKTTARQVRVLQFGGAVGTLAALRERGRDVAAALAAELKLEMPDLPWHSQRDRFAEVATNLGLLTGTMGKIARDVSLLMQNEIAEASEPASPGRGGSSSMPHKRNPIASAVILAAARRVPGLVSTMLSAMVHEHERGLGGWQAEWETLPEICLLTAGALSHTHFMVSGLVVDAKQMEKNLEATRGLIFAEAVTMALGSKMGRSAAHRHVESLCHRAVQNGRHLREELLEDTEIRPHLSPSEIDQLFQPRNYVGSAEAFVEQVLFRRKNV
jgi:3-carboxy-cis,cis-muconate cycloisomerase